MDQTFTIAAGPRQHSHSQVWVLQDSWLHFTVSDLRLLQPQGPGLCIYIPQPQGCPVIPPGPGFHFHHLLRLAGLQWRYSTPPPQGEVVVQLSFSRETKKRWRYSWVVSWKSSCEEKTRRLVWNGHQSGSCQLLREDWQFCWALQGRLRRDSAIVQLIRVLHGWLWQKNMSMGSWRISTVRSRC
jgi:hypothetical protein